MPVVELSNVVEGTFGPYATAGAPTAGTDEVQTLTIDATGGTFRLRFDGHNTAAISWNATNATLIANIDAALEALPNIGTGGVTTAVASMTAGVGTATITFTGVMAKKVVPTITVLSNSLTGTATLTVAETTPGVSASGRGAEKGALLYDTTNGALYQNTGTNQVPVWTAR